jgi:hypothetical protein
MSPFTGALKPSYFAWLLIRKGDQKALELTPVACALRGFAWMNLVAMVSISSAMGTETDAIRKTGESSTYFTVTHNSSPMISIVFTLGSFMSGCCY